MSYNLDFSNIIHEVNGSMKVTTAGFLSHDFHLSKPYKMYQLLMGFWFETVGKHNAAMQWVLYAPPVPLQTIYPTIDRRDVGKQVSTKIENYALHLRCLCTSPVLKATVKSAKYLRCNQDPWRKCVALVEDEIRSGFRRYICSWGEREGITLRIGLSPKYEDLDPWSSIRNDPSCWTNEGELDSIILKDKVSWLIVGRGLEVVWKKAW